MVSRPDSQDTRDLCPPFPEGEHVFSANGAVFILAWGNAPGFGRYRLSALKARFIPEP
jgi:hypothetical protein